jgi:hypothetical protein
MRQMGDVRRRFRNVRSCVGRGGVVAPPGWIQKVISQLPYDPKMAGAKRCHV